MTTQGPVRGGCSPGKKGVQTPALVRLLSIEENERRVYEVGGPQRLSILRRVLSLSYVRQATKLPDLYIRMPLSISAELCSELPRIHLPRTRVNRASCKLVSTDLGSNPPSIACRIFHPAATVRIAFPLLRLIDGETTGFESPPV